MWLFTVHGFFSIVQKEPGVFHIRARLKRDLKNLRKLAGIKAPVLKSYAGSDYPWRIIVGTAEKEQALAALAAGIDYGNFKGAVAARPDQASRLDAYHDVWHRMAGLEG